MKIQKALVKKILEEALSFEWSLQGFGMLRLHMDYDTRLNVWDSRYRVKDVSSMHTHPWNFQSTVVAGRLTNIRYMRAAPDDAGVLKFEHAVIKPGPGGGLRENKGVVSLITFPPQYLYEGERYSQFYNEIHVSEPADGTVTVNERQRVGDDIAYVYWPVGTEWISAEPRKAKACEVLEITEDALKRWFK